MKDVIRLYHGTLWSYANNIKNVGIDLSFTRKDTDFGQGFYLTDDEQTAREWARRRAVQYSEDGAILIYEILQEKMDALCTTNITTLPEAWKREILAHRIHNPQCSADLIIGKIADGKMNRLLKAFHNRQLNEQDLFQRINPLEKKGLQYTFKTSKAIQYLKYIELKKVNIHERRREILY